MTELVEFDPAHKEDLIRILNTNEVEKWLTGPPFPYTESDADIFIKKCEDEKNSSDDIHRAIIVDGEFAGGIGLHKRKDFNEGVIGYYLDKKFWGEGHGTFALRKMMEIAFNELEYERLSAAVFIGNTGSERLLMKCGFSFKESREKSHEKNNKTFDSNLFVKENK